MAFSAFYVNINEVYWFILETPKLDVNAKSMKGKIIDFVIYFRVLPTFWIIYFGNVSNFSLVEDSFFDDWITFQVFEK